MTCESCINKHRCSSCERGELFLEEVKRVKDNRPPSPWEKRWIKWARKEGKKSDGETTVNA